MKTKKVRAKGWAIVDKEGKAEFCEAHPFEMMCKHRAGEYEGKVRVVPCTITYEISADTEAQPARKRRE